MSDEPTAQDRPPSDVIDETREFADHAQRYYETIRTNNGFRQAYQNNPYVMIGAAAGVGYLLAGGLFTPFTRRLLKVGMRAAIVPLAVSQAKAFTDP